MMDIQRDRKRPTALQLALVAAVVVLLDFGTKYLALAHLHEPLRLTSFFTLRVGFNAGVSFGMLQAQGWWGFATLVGITSVLACIVAAGALLTARPAERLGLALIAGGAFANILDRVNDGRVTDFLDFHWGGWHWPAFNLADAAITLGVAVLLLASQTHKPPQKSGTASLEKTHD